MLSCEENRRESLLWLTDWGSRRAGSGALLLCSIAHTARSWYAGVRALERRMCMPLCRSGAMTRKELVTALISASAMPTTHAASGAVRPSAELAALLPPGWSLDFPLSRVRTCGALVVEVLLDLEQRADGRVEAV